MDEPDSKSDKPVTRDARGRLLPGFSGNPGGGRPKAIAEYQEWLSMNALDPAKEALLACLVHEDGKVRMMAVKEVADRLFGKAPQAITGEDGKPLNFGVIMLPPEEK
jgi:hypothetical protein